MRAFFLALSLSTWTTLSVRAADAPVSNAFLIKGALPGWLKPNRLESIAEKMEQKLEWKMKKVPLTFYPDAKAFAGAMQVSNSQVLAFTRREDQSVHLGPEVNFQNLDVILGHELSHVIFMQKYQNKIPPWIEEGLANLQAGYTPLNFPELLKFRAHSVYEFSHPLHAKNFQELHQMYMGATAVAVMLKEKCGAMDELLNLSLKGGLEKEIKIYCEIQDINQSFWTWVEKKAKSPPPKSTARVL